MQTLIIIGRIVVYVFNAKNTRKIDIGIKQL